MPTATLDEVLLVLHEEKETECVVDCENARFMGEKGLLKIWSTFSKLG
jgi:hypothetical protein